MAYWKKSVSWLLVLCMLFSMIPVYAAAAEDAVGGTSVTYADASQPDFYKIVHLDAGRKYISPKVIKKYIDLLAENGYNQLQLYLSDNQGFRFALNDMQVTTSSKTYDLAQARGNGYSQDYDTNHQSWYRPSIENNWLTQNEMTEIIAYAKGKDIEIVPCINMPGHMGAILEHFSDFRYKNSAGNVSKSSVDLSNTEARAFVLGILDKYAAYFSGQGCKYFHIGGDEYAYDLNYNLGTVCSDATTYATIVGFLNDAAEIIKGYSMTPRAFNDFFGWNSSYVIDKDYEITFWSNTANGQPMQSLDTLQRMGYNKLINTNESWYFALGSAYYTLDWTEKGVNNANVNTFVGGTVENPVGAQFCIWNDRGRLDKATSTNEGTVNGVTYSNYSDKVEPADGDGGETVYELTESFIKTFAQKLPVSTVTIKHEQSGVTVTAPELTALECSNAPAENAVTILGAAKTRSYSVTPLVDSTPYTGEGQVSIPVPGGWDASRVFAFVTNSDGTVTKITDVTVENGHCTFTAPHFTVVGIGENAADYAPYHEFTVTAGATHTCDTCVLDGKLLEQDKTYTTDNSLATYTVKHVEDDSGVTKEYVKDTGFTGLAVGKAKTYKISDGNGNYMTVKEGAVANGTEAEAIDWTITKESDTTYSISCAANGGTQYLKLGYYSALLVDSSAKTYFTWNDTNGFTFDYSGHGQYAYLEYCATVTPPWCGAINVGATGFPYTQSGSSGDSTWTTKITFTAGGTNGIDTVTIDNKQFAFQVTGGSEPIEGGDPDCEHEWGEEYQYDDNEHWLACTKCEAKMNRAAHVGGEATCKTQAVCTVCGKFYGAVDPNNHKSLVEVEGTAKEPTEEEDGKEADWRCSACEVTITGATIPAKGAVSVELRMPNTGVSNTQQYESEPTVPTSGSATDSDDKIIATYTTDVTSTYTIESTTELVGERFLCSGEHYLTAAEGTVTDGVAGPNALWTIEKSGDGYTIKSADGDYLGCNNTTLTLSEESTVWSYSDTNGFYIYDSTYNTTNRISYYQGWVAAWYGEFAIVKSLGKTTYNVTATFTPVAVGTAKVTIGDYRYSVTVLEEDLSLITPVTLEYWITCDRVNANAAQTYSLSATQAHSENGIAISTLVPATGTIVGTTATAVFWKGTRLANDKKQTAPGEQTNDDPRHVANDRTHSGEDFQYIRYWDYKWSVSADGEKWSDVQSTDQLVAYYLQKTDIAEEINVQAKDWGYEIGNTGIQVSKESDKRGQVSLSFGLVYETGTMKPTEDTLWSATTVVYDFWDENSLLSGTQSATADRDIGYMTFQETEKYEVYKVTITKGHAVDSAGESIVGDGTSLDSSVVANWTSGTGDWNGWAANVVFDKTAILDGEGNAVTDADGNELQWFNEVTVWDETVGGTPYLDALNLAHEDAIESYTDKETEETSIRWETAGTSYLILLYIRSKEAEEADQLTVRYFDDTNYSEDVANADYQFHTFHISVGSGKTFTNGLSPSFTTTLQDGSSIKNSVDVTEYIYTDLLKIPTLYGTKYVSGAYTFTRSELSEDGKTLDLHYSLGETKYLVVDFGLPVEITREILGIESGWSIQSIAPPSYALQYGKLVDENGADVTETCTKLFYELTTVMQKPEFFSIEVTIAKDNEPMTVPYGVYVVPATTVYYEEGFAGYTGDWGDNVLKNLGVEKPQQSANPKTESKYNYGYDAAYAEQENGPSAGSQAVSNAVGDKAIFSFVGTGVDIYANTTPNSGYAMVILCDADGKAVKVYNVDTRMKNGDSTATDGQAVNAYNVPIVAIRDLAYGAYSVEIRHIINANDLMLDGFRVYNTMDNRADAIYGLDKESTPVFTELRDHVLGTLTISKNASENMYAEQIAKNTFSQVYATSEKAKALVIADGTKQDDVDNNVALDLTVNGPKNEIYLRPNETLAFKVETNNYMGIQVGMKALNKDVTYRVNSGESITLTTGTDMFYPVEPDENGVVTIKNESGGILSITKLKGIPNATVPVGGTIDLLDMDEVDVGNALVANGYALRTPVEDDPIEDDPVEDDPVEDDPVEDHPVEDDPTEDDPVPEKVLGDVNGDGTVNTTDARLVLQYAVDKIDASALDLSVADVNRDGTADTTDARLILQKAVNKIEDFA